MLRRTLATLAVAGAALLGATAAQAETRWSIGINLPPAGVVVSNGGYYVEAAPVYYAPAPVYQYAPRPRYVEREVYYAPPPRVVYETTYRERRWDRRDDRRWGHDRHDRHERWDDRRDYRRDDYGPSRGR